MKAGLWAGLNVYQDLATNYSSHRPHHARTPHRGSDHKHPGGRRRTFNLDHAILLAGDEPDSGKHWGAAAQSCSARGDGLHQKGRRRRIMRLRHG